MKQRHMRGERKTDTGNGIVRMAYVALAFALQLLFVYSLMYRLNAYSTMVHIIVETVAVFIVLSIYGSHETTSMKMPWIVLIASAPLLGVVMWALFACRLATRPMRERFQKVDQIIFGYLHQEPGTQEALREESPAAAGTAQYLWRRGHFPLYRNDTCRYYADAMEALEAQLEDLRNAKSFIFMEYFAIENKEAFGRIRKLLRKKAAEGVTVRLFYDDVGSVGFINSRFVASLREDGIEARVFNPMIPGLRVFMNNRDHRKITVIDGEVAYTGGYNLADEYFNLTQPYGEWKDAGIRVTGPAVDTFTTVFLEMWNAIRHSDEDDIDFRRFYPEHGYNLQPWSTPAPPAAAGTGKDNEEDNVKDNVKDKKRELSAQQNEPGFVQPYADSPLDEEQIGESVYMSIANCAENYLYFVTPYLVLTDEMSRAMTMAAERGVDVRVITPGIPDKKITYQLTRSYYAQLVKKGVRIYEFAPGFCHAKCCVSDDKIATCGTINLDYRSLYHHFEDGCVMYGMQAVLDMKEDLDAVITRSREVTERYTEGGRNVFVRIIQCVLRLVAPLF